ncbi:hypothetical protein NLM33_23025 [Bradyrhizobium sp. CCGUVB1N3]|nr:hypothetical protein [Bradyrhizobium sp. CCGUVB1N3]MCP3473190.1 hypothetical protein [Bradyrhizobium sp. CCGUVB1N3]
MQDGVVTLRGRFAWAHDFDPDRSIAATFQALPGASFVVNGAAQARSTHQRVCRDEVAERLVGGGKLRRRVLERHAQLCRQGPRSLRVVSGRFLHALFAGQGTTWPDITSRSRPLSLAA